MSLLERAFIGVCDLISKATCAVLAVAFQNEYEETDDDRNSV